MRGGLVEPEARRARAQAGATWADYNRDTQAWELASTGGIISTTGVAGLTLGGGLGWLMGKYSMAVDALRAVELVTADGGVVRTSETENPDLFWGLRGGGGNFGVATWFEYEVYPVGPTVTGGLVAFPFDDARDVLRFYREFTASLPDEITVFGGLVHAPDGSGAKLAAIIVCHCGPLADGERAVQPIKAFGRPAMDALGPLPYSAMNSMLDAGHPKGAQNYWKSNFLAALDDAMIDTMVERFEACPSPMSALLLEHFHGAATRVGVGETAFPHRTTGHNFLALGQWLDPSENEANIAWVRETYEAVAPQFAPRRYVNYLNADEVGEADAVAEAFGENFSRLRELKRKYDPHNVFHLNQNVRP